MSRSIKNNKRDVNPAIIRDERAWADFFITRVGLIIFAAVLLLAAFKAYPMFQEKEIRAHLDGVASDLVAQIEAVDSTTIQGNQYTYVFDEKNKNIKIEISTEYVVARISQSTAMWGEREIVHAEPIMTHVYPQNSKWKDETALRDYLSEKYNKKNGAFTSQLDPANKKDVDDMFEGIKTELAKEPFTPDLSKPLKIEKVIIYYSDGQERDYVLVNQ